MSSLFDSAPTFELTEPTGRLEVHVPRPGLVVTRIRGHFSSTFAGHIETIGEREMPRGGFVGLHEWTETQSFDLAVPTTLGAWSMRRLGSIARIVIATTHPIVGLAVRTTNLTIKRIEHLDSALPLERVIEEELHRRAARVARR